MDDVPCLKRKINYVIACYEKNLGVRLRCDLGTMQISVYSEFTFTHVIHGKVVVCNLSQLALIEKASIFLIYF